MEILTLQCGSYANHIGAHLWNLRLRNDCGAGGHGDDEEDGEVAVADAAVFRQRRDGTVLGRVLALDVRGSLGARRLFGIPRVSVDEAAEAARADWGDGRVEIIEQDCETNELVEELNAEDAMGPQGATGADAGDGDEEPRVFVIDDHVQTWSDYFEGQLAPQSVLLARDYIAGVHAFDSFAQGVEWTRREDTADEIEDRLRYFLEDCDHLGGVQLLVDYEDGFGGAGRELWRAFRQECPKTAACLAPVSEAKDDTGTPHLALNRALALQWLAEDLHSVTMPLRYPHAEHPAVQACGLSERRARYHTSAVLAAHLDTCTLGFRKSPSGPGDFVRVLRDSPGRFLCESGGAVPVPLVAGERNCFDGLFRDPRQVLPTERDWFIPLSPTNRTGEGHRRVPSNQMSVLRGLPSWASRSPYPLLPSYSLMFPDPVHLPRGFPRTLFQAETHTLPMFSHMGVHSGIGRFVDEIARGVKPALRDGAAVAALQAHGMEVEDAADTEQLLWTVVDSYAEDGDGDGDEGNGSDSGDEDW